MSGEDALKSKGDALEKDLDEVGEDGPLGEDGPPGGLDMSALQGMLGGMGGEGGEGGAGGMDMSALMSMLGGKGGGKDGMADMLAGMGGKGGGKGGMADMMAGMGGGMGGGKGGYGAPAAPAAKDDSEKACEGGKWHWQQKGEEIQVRFPTEGKITKKEIVVKFKRTSIHVAIKGEVVVDATLGGAVEVDECTWCIAPGGEELQVMLTKQKEADWPSLVLS